MKSKLSEKEIKSLLKGVGPKDPPMSTEKFKSIWIKHYMGEGKSSEEAKKIVDDMCIKHGVT
jgi:hypothetical protein